MSSTVSAPLTNAERTNARRFCGYPAYGSGQTGFESWRFFAAYGSLEYRLSNLSSDELVVMRGYLDQLSGLELAIVGAGQNLDTDQAAVWHRNTAEVRDRTALFASWCCRLCSFLGVPRGPGLTTLSEIRV
jgi:hypothetical protein